jgi:methyltransferase-like protein
MMMLYRLVRLIETHSQALASCLLDQVQKSELTPCYKKNVPPEELKESRVRNLPPSGGVAHGQG